MFNSEIWNLNSLCRCCHTDGNFKSLNLPYTYNGKIENYTEMLQNSFNINLAVPSISVSNMICDVCISSLRDAILFKEQIVACEVKFQEYVKNELALLPSIDIKEEGFEEHVNKDVKIEDVKRLKNVAIKIKIEPKSDIEDDVHSDRNYDLNNSTDKESPADGSSVLTVPTATIHDTRQNGSGKKDPTQRKSIKTRKDVKKRGNPKNNSEKIKRVITTKCEVCLKDMPSRELDEHIKNTHTIPYCCKFCELQFSDYDSLKRHVNSHPDAKRFVCDICNKSYKAKAMFECHKNLHTRQKVFQCDICNKEFLYKSILIRHIEVHKGEKRTDKRYACPNCSKVFNNNSYLSAHIQTVHEKLKPFRCTICLKSYAAKKSLTVHFRLHTGELPYKCETCTQQFRSFYHLKNHNKKMHVQRPDNCKDTQQKNCYKCKRCNQMFDHRGLFIAHLKTHPVKGLICDQCGKGFYCAYSLNRHIINHTGVKPFGCDLCSRKYTTKFQLRRHITKLHDKNVQKFKCEICGKEVENLQQHLKNHNDRRFACQHCDKKYSQRNALNRHLLELHGSFNLYGCELCGKRYVIKRSLLKHKCKVIKDEMTKYGSTI